MGENVVPQMAAQFPHARALAAQPVDEEEVGAARLKKNAEETGRLILRKAALRQQRQRLGRKSDPHRLVARADLFLDESVQLVIEAVEGLEEKHVSHHIAFLSRITAELRRAPAFQFPHLGGHGAPEELGALVLILESARDPAVQFEPLLAERVGEHGAGDPLPEFAVAPLGPGFACHAKIVNRTGRNCRSDSRPFPSGDHRFLSDGAAIQRLARILSALARQM